VEAWVAVEEAAAVAAVAVVVAVVAVVVAVVAVVVAVVVAAVAAAVVAAVVAVVAAVVAAAAVVVAAAAAAAVAVAAVVEDASEGLVHWNGEDKGDATPCIPFSERTWETAVDTGKPRVAEGGVHWLLRTVEPALACRCFDRPSAARGGNRSR